MTTRNIEDLKSTEVLNPQEPVNKTTDEFIREFMNGLYPDAAERAAMCRRSQAAAEKKQVELQELLKDGYMQFPGTEKIPYQELPSEAQNFLKSVYSRYAKNTDSYYELDPNEQAACRISQYRWLRHLYVPTLTRDQYAEILDTYITVLEHVPSKTEINQLHELLGAPSAVDFARTFGERFPDWLKYYFSWQIRNGANPDDLIKEYHEVHMYPLDFLKSLIKNEPRP